MAGTIEKMARAMAAGDSGPEGSTLFEIHWREFGEGYFAGARAAYAVARREVMEECREAYEAHDKTDREWVSGSLWDKLNREGAARVRALTNLDPTKPVDSATRHVREGEE